MRQRFIRALWLLADILLFIGSYLLAYFLRVGWIFSTDFPILRYLAIVSLVSPLFLGVLASTGTFRWTQSQHELWQYLATLYATVIGSALFALGYYFAFGLFFSRLLLIEALLLSFTILRIWHLLFEQIARHLLRQSPPAFPTLIIGVTRESKRLLSALQSRKNPLTPVAILDGRGTSEKSIDGVPVLGKLDRLEATLKEKHITHLIQCSDIEQSLNLLSACRQHRITYILLPSVLGIVEHDERVESLEGAAVMVVRPKQ